MDNPDHTDEVLTAKRTLVEIKARCSELVRIEEVLMGLGAEFKGCDHQIDTYFEPGTDCRLKLRRGNIENSLIQYSRADEAAAKQSDVNLHRPANRIAADSLEAVLKAALPVKVVVDKQRKIYFIGNVKFHLDRVDQLGTFLEIEAIDSDGSRNPESLREQCQYYQKLLGVKAQDLLTHSYSDMLLTQRSTH